MNRYLSELPQLFWAGLSAAAAGGQGVGGGSVFSWGLGDRRLSCPRPQIHNGERKAYALKSKELTGPTKGVIFLEIDVIYNAVSPLFLSRFFFFFLSWVCFFFLLAMFVLFIIIIFFYSKHSSQFCL